MFRLSSLMIVGLITAVIYLAVNRQGRLAQAGDLRTRQIAAAQQELEQHIQERTRELSTLQDISRRIGSTLALDPLLGQIRVEMKPVLDYTVAHIIRLDETGRLVLAPNSSVAGWMPRIKVSG